MTTIGSEAAIAPMGAKRQVLTTRFLNVSGLDGSDRLSYSGKIRYIDFLA
jgi:hypothetical protein